MSHSCNPSARPHFPTGTAELHLVATRALKKGDELTVAYVDVSSRSAGANEEEVVVENENEKEKEETEEATKTTTGTAHYRRSRRLELASGWRFACVCERCVAEGAESADGKDSDVGLVKRDDSKVEDVIGRAELAAASLNKAAGGFAD